MWVGRQTYIWFNRVVDKQSAARREVKLTDSHSVLPVQTHVSATAFRCGEKKGTLARRPAVATISAQTVDPLHWSHKEPHTPGQGNKESFETLQEGK